ncbi:Transposon Ty3-I Gag-Pol polyprotein [Senna tora]|uniref:Transposon Ty3-I Gag-Pol polyprotein n=1 Tax=Senna tora TaxID=362788 RepID=A0A834TGM5_9FABA|nr:Transposon Ty3-I Gag-Pol polyprotein [Senna tora]
MAERSKTTHEEQGAKHGKKGRPRSREALADAEARLARVELAIAEGEDKFEEVNQRIEELDKGKVELREAMQGALNLTLDKCLGQVKSLEETFMAEIIALKEELVRVTDELNLCKKVIAQGGHVEELDNFLWGEEQYFKALGITEEASKIDTVTLYLDDTARMWWRGRQGDVEKGTCTINTWVEFKKELKQQFYLVNVEEEARAKLRRLQHKGTIRDYVKDFTEVLLEIPDYPDKEAFFAFVDGLQNWHDKPKTKDKGGKGKSGGKGNQSKAGSHKPESSKGSKEFKRGEKPPLKCFLCEGPHRARHCAKKAKLSALVKESEEREQEGAKVSSLQLLCAIKAKVEMSESGRNGRTFVEAKAGDRVTKALVDCGASHNFLQVEEARRLGIHYKDERGWLKAVNSDPIEIFGVARGITVSLGELNGPVDFFVVTMDDYPIVLSMEFSDKLKAVLVPFANTMCISEEGNTSIVPLEREAKIKAKSISAMQLAKGMEKGQPTYVAAIKEEEGPLSGSVPEKVQKLNDAERRYTVQEKEMTVVVHCLRTWRHYLLGSKFVVKTDNVATSYFLSQKKLTAKQARWQDFLAEFDFVTEFKPRKANFVADSLSRKAELAAITTSQSKTRRFWLEDGVLVTKGSRTYIPTWQGLRREIIKECHDSKWAGHPGVRRTLALVERAYYWPLMRDDIELYVRTCLVCQQDKKSESTGGCSFQIATGQQPMTPHTLAVGYTGPSPTAFKFAKGWHENSDMPRAYLAKARERLKKWADVKRRHLEFEEGDLVMVKLLPHQTRRFAKLHKGLVRRYEETFPVEKRIGKLAYRLVLPSHLEMHPVFHLSFLKPYRKDMEDPSRGETRRAQTAITEVPERVVEEVLAHRVVPCRGSHTSYVEYLVKWKGAPDSEASWEHELTLWNHKDLIEAYKQEATRMSPD